MSHRVRDFLVPRAGVWCEGECSRRRHQNKYGRDSRVCRLFVMKRVVLFRTACEEYQEAFKRCNYDVVFVEPLQFVYINSEELKDKLQKDAYTGLVLTSPRGVEAISKCWDPSKFVLWKEKKIYTVGEASGYRIKLLLGLDAMGMNSGNSENLSELIVKENPEGSKFLFPCGNLRLEILPNALREKGIELDSLTVYETKVNERLKEELIEADSGDEVPVCLVFFSPSGCEYVHRQLQTLTNRLSHLPRFAIGNTTAHKIETLGMEIAGVAEQVNPNCMAEAVQKYFQKQ